MNRGEHKTLVTIVLLVVSLLTAIAIELINGAAGAAPSLDTVKPGSVRVTQSTQQVAPSAGGATASGTYHTVGTNVRLRASATTASAVVTVMPDLGARLTLTCYRQGQPVFGDPYWYQASYGSYHGWVSGFWVATGPDPTFTRLRECP